MLIRAEQMSVFETTAEENFRRRLAAHLLENYAAAIVRLPDSESAVKDLSAEKLHSLVEISIERARRHELTFESSISAFSALMFEVSPNFDSHRLSQVMLSDENVEPNARLNELLGVLTEKNWESIRQDYDVNAWQPEMETGENSEEAEKFDEEKPADAETAMNVEKPERTKDAVAIDDINFDETIRGYGSAKKPARAGNDEDIDMLDTVPNFIVGKE